MQNLGAFRDFFSLTEGSRAVYQEGACWIRLRVNDLGLLRLQLGEHYEGVIAELMWYKDELVAAEGSNFNLAALLYVAERLGLPTDHPQLDPIRQTEEYKEMLRTGEIVLE